MGRLNLRNLDYEKVFNVMVESTALYIKENGLKCMVLGISGGIDSSVTACICHKVSEKYNIPLIGVSLPCSTNKEDEVSTASLIGKEFCDEFYEVNLQSLFENAECVFNSIGLESTPISQGNIKARLRGNFLYNIAGIKKGIVMDTDMVTENMLGFWTISGDECDFNPIGELWKHEVYLLAEYIFNNVYKNSEGLKKSIELIPTDGNGVSNSDLEQIAPGYTYDDVDRVLYEWSQKDKNEQQKIYGMLQSGNFDFIATAAGMSDKFLVMLKNLLKRVMNSEFKRKQRPLIIDINNGNVCEKNGEIYKDYRNLV